MPKYMWKYVRNNIEIRGNYEEICSRRGSTRIPLNYKLWDLGKFRVSALYMESCKSTILVLQARYE